MGIDRVEFVAGLDLGKSRDFAALALLACKGPCSRLVGLRRWPLGTTYPTILEDVKTLVERPPLAGTRPALVVDATGVGVGFVDFLRPAGLPVVLAPVSITSGARERLVDGVFRVPKSNLADALRATLEARTLTVAPGLAGAEALAGELRGFETRLTKAGNEVFGAFKSGAHDDIALALALALWLRRRRLRLP